MKYYQRMALRHGGTEKQADTAIFVEVGRSYCGFIVTSIEEFSVTETLMGKPDVRITFEDKKRGRQILIDTRPKNKPAVKPGILEFCYHTQHTKTKKIGIMPEVLKIFAAPEAKREFFN